MARPKGAQGKNKAFLLKKLQDMYGDDFNPVIKMAENAVKLQAIADASADDANDRKAALDGWDKVANYVEPKLKAVEHTGGVDLRNIVKRIDLTGSDANN